MHTPDGSESLVTFRTIIGDAMRFWEPRRVLYNAVLAGIALAWLVFTWPHFRPAITPQSFFALLALATLANMFYCAAYLADFAMQRSSFRNRLRRQRWSLWLAGTLFAVLLEYYWIADEIYPAVR